MEGSTGPTLVLEKSNTKGTGKLEPGAITFPESLTREWSAWDKKIATAGTKLEPGLV